MRVCLLHLSDVHFQNASDRAVRRAAAIASTLNAEDEQIDLCLVMVSGDVAYHGTSAEYEVAGAFFSELMGELRKNAHISSAEIVFVPGNHDCDFSSPDEPRDMLLQQIRHDPNRVFSAKTLSQCTSVQNAFFSFASELEGVDATADDIARLFRSTVFKVGAHGIRVDRYNTAWVSTLNEQHGGISFPALSDEPPSEPLDLVVSMFHHPYSWFQTENGKLFKKRIDARSELVLTGHEHDVDAYQRKDLTTGASLHYSEGGALQRHGASTDSEFVVISIDLTKRQRRHVHYAWSKDQYKRRAESAWSPLARTQTAFTAPLRPSAKFEASLDDCEAPFTHAAKRVLRSDLFILPQFREMEPDPSEKPSPSEIVSGSAVLNAIFEERHVLIYGEDASGKTAFAKEVCVEALRRGLVPLYLSGKDFSEGPDLGVPNTIKKNFDEQYDCNDRDKFDQLPSSKRIVVVDDLHRSTIKAAQKTQLLQRLEHTFDVVVIVGDDLQRLEEIARSRSDEKLTTHYRHFSILELGFELREKLITKWHQLDRDRLSGAEELVRTVANLRRELDSVLGKRLVPSYPLFILIILQQIEASTPLTTVHGSYGYLYEALITKALADVERDKEDLDTLYAYLSELAHYCFVNRKKKISQQEFEEAHQRYVRDYDVPLPFQKVRETLLKSGLLLESARQYSFKYKYTYYYFVARHISRDSPATHADTVDRLASALYREEDANIIMFLCYFSRDASIVDRLMSNARTLFAESLPIDFASPIAAWDELREAKPALQLPSGPTSESRAGLLASVDKARALRRAEEDAEVTSDFDDVVRLNVAMKTLQILGQVLRNFRGSLKADTKVEIARECYQLGLRTISRVFKLLEDHVQPLLDELVKSLRDRHFDHIDAVSRAKRVVLAIGEMLALSMLKRIASAVGTQRLEQTYDKVRNQDDTIAVKLVDAAIRLEHFNEFPETEVTALVRLTNKLPFPYGLLRMLVFENFYLYPVAMPLRQRVCAQLDIATGSTGRASHRKSQQAKRLNPAEPKRLKGGPSGQS